jgi:tripartite-type tricarboxylate transporter receptor subunit TctC
MVADHQEVRHQGGLMRALLSFAIFAASVAAAPARGQDIYADKTVTIFSGHSPGSLYDTNARFLARHIGRFLPGHPTVIVRNMPGAGTLTAANHVANVAPKDGTALMLPARGVAIEPLLGGQGVRFEPLKLHWIGSTSQEVSIIAVRADTGVKTLDDARTRELAVAGSGADATTFPNALNHLLGTRFKVITGYRSGAEMNLAIDRKEVDGRGSWSWSAFRNDGMPRVARGELNMLVQMGTSKIPQLPQVPLVMDLAASPEQRQVLDVLLAAQAMAWPLFAAPEVPAERVALLRRAYLAMLKDDATLGDARKTGVDIDPVSGTVIGEMLARVYATPPAVVAKAKVLSGRK